MRDARGHACAGRCLVVVYEAQRAPGGAVEICLLCDPDLPAEIAGRLCGDLPARLQRDVSSGVRWDVRRVVAPLVGDEQLAVSGLSDLLRENLQDDAWDVGVFITDLPRRSQVRPVAAEVAVRERIALVSLPAMGPLRVYARTRAAVIRLVAELVQTDHHPESPVPRVAGLRRDKRPRLPSASIDPLRPDPAAGSGARALGSRPVAVTPVIGRRRQP